jgi:GNAT superfamily N-acetyltransferase
MLNERTVYIAKCHWASHFGCSTEELFAEPLRILTHAAGLADYWGVFALFRERGAIVSFPQAGGHVLRPLLEAQRSGSSPEGLALALGPISSAVIGPAYIGYAEAVSAPSHPTCALTHRDLAAALVLQAACSKTEWDHGGTAVGDHPASGVLVNQRLVALAGYEVWCRSIAHISIVTHPDFRGRGFGRSAVAHLAARALAAGLVPQYRTLESNRASMRIAESLGFSRFATSIAVRLDTNPGL